MKINIFVLSVIILIISVVDLSSASSKWKNGQVDVVEGEESPRRVHLGGARFDTRKPYEPEYWDLIPRGSEYKKIYGDNPRKGLLKDIKPDDFFNFIPTYIGNVVPGKPITWQSTCFKDCSATLTVNGNQSAHLTVSMNNKQSFLCDEMYLIGYVGAFDIIPYVFTGDSSTNWDGGWPDEQLYDIQNNGLRLFRFPDGLTGTPVEIFETLMLFFGALIGTEVPNWTAADNLQFLADHMNVVMEPRTIQRVDIPLTEYKTGDFLGIIRLDGLDPMLAWAMGSHTGHTAITWWIDGELYVLESTVDSKYWPTNGIQKTKFATWMDQAQAADYNVVHLPLNPAIAAKINSTAAMEFYNSVEGLPYGFHNLFTGWIDTEIDNYPPPLDPAAVMLLASYAEWIMAREGKSYDYLAQTLNHRLNTNGLTINQVYMEAGKKGLSFADMVIMPELDEWIFEDANGASGPSMVCDVFVMRMWKAAGIFGDLANQIQAAEFTNWDAYSLNIFDGNYKRPQVCVTADPTSQFCQILGQYRMALPDYNSVAPYANMREKCPSLAPDYKKPVGC